MTLTRSRCGDVGSYALFAATIRSPSRLHLADLWWTKKNEAATPSPAYENTDIHRALFFEAADVSMDEDSMGLKVNLLFATPWGFRHGRTGPGPEWIPTPCGLGPMRLHRLTATIPEETVFGLYSGRARVWRCEAICGYPLAVVLDTNSGHCQVATVPSLRVEYMADAKHDERVLHKKIRPCRCGATWNRGPYCEVSDWCNPAEWTQIGFESGEEE